jgi:hypothetical protein
MPQLSAAFAPIYRSRLNQLALRQADLAGFSPENGLSII